MRSITQEPASEPFQKRLRGATGESLEEKLMLLLAIFVSSIKSDNNGHLVRLAEWQGRLGGDASLAHRAPVAALRSPARRGFLPTHEVCPHVAETIPKKPYPALRIAQGRAESLPA